ncbi:MAG: polymorphic toxin-type HINT domain-containing protein, partial [Patescibacteria group bacterium]|nr:polymorphic toxin-type HINT domain-containing protein [Patescibacteria group bacterium]
PRTKRVYPKWFAGLALGIGLAGILFFGGLGWRSERADSTARASHTAVGTATMARVAPPTRVCRAIETIGVGQRVITTPDGVFGNPSTESTAVNPATWRKVLLEATSVWEDGTRDVVRVETLQPLEWLEQHGAKPGVRVPFPLDLVEMGIPDDLLATVVAVEPCPTIEAGPGRVVLTTVDHLNAFVFELALEDAAGSITTVRPTGWHRFYSETRADWVPAKDLSPGEQVGGLSGSLTVIATSRVPGTHRVYNMTVEGDHVYHVTTLGALVHNNGCKQVAAPSSASKPPIWSSPSGKTSVENAFGHWQKHGAEFPQFQNAKQYVEGARNFMNNPPAGTLTKVRTNGDTLFYNPATNTFAVRAANGAPRTMFKPNGGMNYWNNQ